MKTSKILTCVLLVLFGAFMVACGGNEPDTERDDETIENNEDTDTEGLTDVDEDAEPVNLQEAMKEAEKAMKNMQKTEPVNFRDLQKLTPEKLAGMERTSKSGETTGALGMKISRTEAKYKTDDDKTIEVEIVDTGGLGMGIMSMAAWSTATIDKEDEYGYERTGTLDGFRSFEKFRKNSNRNELSVIAKDRYIVSANCSDCKMDQLKKVIREMDLKDELPETK